MEPTAALKSESLSFSFATEAAVRDHEGVMRARIWGMLERLGCHPGLEMVEEILQETYCRLFEGALRRWRGRSLCELLAYVGIVAERTALDHFRGDQARKRNLREVHLGRRRIEQIADPRDPEQDFLHAENQAVLLRSCHDLPARGGRQRNAWVARLAFLEGLTNQEIASAAGGRLSPGNVACLVHRLRRRLERRGFGKGSRPDRSSRRQGSRRRKV